MTRARLSRRSLLAATGASSLLLPLLHQDRARGAEGTFPLRVIFCVTGNGTTEEAFWPTGTDGNLTLGGITSPLEAHKDKLIFTRGVDMRVWAEENPFGGNGDAHHNWGAVLTATKLATGDAPHDPGGPGLALASSESIDIRIGKELDKQIIAAGGMGLPFPTLSVRARGGTGSGRNTLSWTGDRAPVSAEGDPRKLFDSLFAGYMGDKPDPAQVRLRKKRQSVLDYVGGALERQVKNLGTEDRHKVELHLEAVRSIEKQLGGGAVTATCKPPTVEAGVDFKLDMNMPKLVTAQHDLITAALSCGLTRTVTFGFADAENYDIYFPFLPISQVGVEFPTRHHHDISHRPGENNGDKIKVENWIIGQFAGLLDKLSAVPEGDGTLMDNTVVMWMNSLNSGFSHTVLKLPMVIAAGKNVPIRTGGRLIELKQEAHNRVLAALANAVGVPMQGWGDARYPGITNLT